MVGCNNRSKKVALNRYTKLLEHPALHILVAQKKNYIPQLVRLAFRQSQPAVLKISCLAPGAAAQIALVMNWLNITFSLRLFLVAVMSSPF